MANKAVLAKTENTTYIQNLREGVKLLSELKEQLQKKLSDKLIVGYERAKLAVEFHNLKNTLNAQETMLEDWEQHYEAFMATFKLELAECQKDFDAINEKAKLMAKDYAKDCIFSTIVNGFDKNLKEYPDNDELKLAYYKKVKQMMFEVAKYGKKANCIFIKAPQNNETKTVDLKLVK